MVSEHELLNRDSLELEPKAPLVTSQVVTKTGETEPLAAIITIENLQARYHSVIAVDGISLEIKRGECFGLLGPNGAGKTTILACLEGIKQYQAGTITINGLDVAKEPGKVKRLLGVQLQHSSLFPDLTTIEIIQFYNALYGVYPTRKEAVKLLERFDLGNKAKAKVGQLSGGQQQRLTLLLAIAHNPSVILLDEPTVGLDPNARRNIWEIVRQMRSEGKTIILTTHYIEEAELLCQRVGIINQGKILALGTPHQLIDQMGNISTLMLTVPLSDEQIQQLSAAPLVHSLEYDLTQLVIQTPEPQKVLASVESLSGSRVQDVVIRRPNLEDVFISLTGRSLVEKNPDQEK